MEIAGYLGAVLMGISLGLFGGGGSILSVPILVYLFGLDVISATGLSLFIVGTTSAAGLTNYHRQGNIEWRTATLFGGASLLSVFATRRWLVPALPDPLFQMGELTVPKDTAILGLFAVVMVLAAWSMLRKRKAVPTKEAGKDQLLPLLLIGLAVGILTGLLGAGGGFVIVPALVVIAGVDMKKAVGTSLLIITANAFIGFLGDRQVHLIDHAPLLIMFIALAIGGIFVGGLLAKRIDGNRLRPAFGWFILTMGAYIIIRELYTLT